jgi:hypothetical protein
LPFFFFFDFLLFGGGISTTAGVGVEMAGVSKPPGITAGAAGRGRLSVAVEADSNDGTSVCCFFLPFFAAELSPAGDPDVDDVELEPWLT